MPPVKYSGGIVVLKADGFQSVMLLGVFLRNGVYLIKENNSAVLQNCSTKGCELCYCSIQKNYFDGEEG